MPSGCSAARARLADRGATISRSTSSPTSAATSLLAAAGARADRGLRERRRRAAARPRARLRRVGAHDRQRAAAGRTRRSAARARRRRSRRRSRIPDASARRRPRSCSAPFAGGRSVGVHVSGGRAIKQWARSAISRGRRAAGRAIVGAAIVLTGTPADRALVDDRPRGAAAGSRDRPLGRRRPADASPRSSRRLDLFVTGDTGPMHLAVAVGTPVVAVFGPSDPRALRAARPARLASSASICPCSPCNRIRLPPARCVGHTPDCLAGIEVGRGARAAIDDARRSAARTARAAAHDRRVDAIDAGAGPTRGRSARVPRRRRATSARTTTRTPGSRRCATSRVDGVPLRRRFTFRGDSLWWFAELYLHKEQAILTRLPHDRARSTRSSSASGRSAVGYRRGGRHRPALVAAGRRGAQASATTGRGLRGRPALGAGARWTRARSGAQRARRSAVAAARAAPAPADAARAVAAFVHRAFWRAGRRRRQRRVVHRPGARARSSRGSARRHPLRRRRPARELPRAALVASAASARGADDGRRRSRRSRRSARWRRRARIWRRAARDAPQRSGRAPTCARTP